MEAPGFFATEIRETWLGVQKSRDYSPIEECCACLGISLNLSPTMIVPVSIGEEVTPTKSWGSWLQLTVRSVLIREVSWFSWVKL